MSPSIMLCKLTPKFQACYPKTQRINTDKIIMIVVFYECETRSLTVRKTLRVKVFENRLLSGISGKRNEVRREWE